MAFLIPAPHDIKKPEYTDNNMQNAHEFIRYQNEIVEFCKKDKSAGELSGSLLRFQVENGYAVYVVLATRDNEACLMRIPDKNGLMADKHFLKSLTLTEVKYHVEAFKNKDKLFPCQSLVQPNEKKLPKTTYYS